MIHPAATRRWALAIMLIVSLTAWSRNERDTLGAGTLVHFVENLGQWDARVRYEVQLKDAAVFLESGGVTVALKEHVAHPHPQKSMSPPRYHAYKMHFVGATPTLPMGYDQEEGYSNYFLGDDPSRWRSKVGSYVSVRYEGLYPGVALELYGGSKALKYNFIVDAGADASTISLEYEGVEALNVNREGNLMVRTSVRDVVELKPYVYQGER